MPWISDVPARMLAFQACCPCPFQPFFGISFLHVFPERPYVTQPKTPQKPAHHHVDQASDPLKARTYFIGDSKCTAPRLAPALYVTATPIGNLRDITLRALEVLAAADIIACEDTRTSRVLLNHYGINARLVAYHEHNADAQRPYLTQCLEEGKAVALISDAGTPLVSDPGFKLVRDLVAAGLAVVPIPGASALTTALAGAGLATDAVHFAGFLPQKTGKRRQKLETLTTINASLVFFESPHRIADSLADMAAVLGGTRQSVVARELTKRYEEFLRGPLDELAARLAEKPVKGEIVVIVEGPPDADDAPSADDLDQLLRAALARDSLKSAVQAVVAATGLKKRDVYQRALQLDKGDSAG